MGGNPQSFRVNGFGLVSYYIFGVVRDCLIVDGRLGGLGDLGAIVPLVVVLV